MTHAIPTRRFVSYARIRGTVLTRAEVAALEVMPAGFTGVWHGQHMYMGRRWDGPTNRMGRRS